MVNKGRSRGQWVGVGVGLLGILSWGSACAILPGEDRSTEILVPIQTTKTLPRVEREPTYQRYETARSPIHVVLVPGDGSWQVVPRVQERLTPLPEFAEEDAIALINAGFFDPANQLTTSAIVVNGLPVADPRQNPRLMENPDLTPYLDRILNRSEFRSYRCGGSLHYGIARHQDAIPPGCSLPHALGAGPRLLPQLDLEGEGFREVVNGQVVRDAIGSDRPNARSAVGIRANGDLLLVMAAQQTDAPQNSGLTLPELAQFLASHGAVEALNLDGGSSAGLVFQGEAFYGRVDAQGQFIQRPIKSVLAVVPGPS